MKLCYMCLQNLVDLKIPGLEGFRKAEAGNISEDWRLIGLLWDVERQ